MKRFNESGAAFFATFAIGAVLSMCWNVAAAQTAPGTDAPPDLGHVLRDTGDRQIFANGVLDQIEIDVANARGGHWEGEVWVGTTKHRFWLRSQGAIDRRGETTDGRLDVLYDHPISTFFDVQAGLRYDLDTRPGGTWAAFGVEGHIPYRFKGWATAYVGDEGRYALAVRVSYDRALTERLILQPEVKFDLYSRDDPERRIGSGAADLNLGLRLRYEASDRFAPYIGVTYRRLLGETAEFARVDREPCNDARVVAGVRMWF